MTHTPYGYRIENGEAVVFEEEAAKVRALFEYYCDGLAIAPAAKKAGINKTHSVVGRLLRNKHYLGDVYYPAIIDQEIFDIAEEERIKRAGDLGRTRELEDKTPALVLQKYRIGPVPQKYADPFEQAAYAYSLIESEES